MLRDLAALNKRELLAWDVWGLVRSYRPGDAIPEDTAMRLDELASVTTGAAPEWKAIREIYEREEFRVPPAVLSFRQTGPKEVLVE